MKDNAYIKSFKTFEPKLVHTTLLDFVYAILFLAIGIFSYFLLSYAFELAFNIWLFAAAMILVFVSSYILVAANMAFFKGMVWNITTGKKRKFIDTFRFTLIWFIPWALVFYLLRNALPENTQVFILTAYFFIYLHFTAAARICFEKSAKHAFSQAYRIGFWQFPKLILPYILILLTTWVVMFAASTVLAINETAFMVVSAVAALLLIAWSRYYISLVYQKLK
jgi:hypothetical protein